MCPGLEELQEVILFVVDVSLPVPGNTASVCYLCSSHAGNNGPWECWLPGRPLVTPLCHSSVCSDERPLNGPQDLCWRDFPYFLLFHFP